MNIDYLLASHGFGGKKSKDKIPPPNVIGFSANTVGNDIKLTWTNPKDSDFVGVVVVRKEGSFPTDTHDGSVIFKDMGTSYIDKNVIKAKYWYYRAFAYDFDNNINKEDSQTTKSIVKGSQETPPAPTLSSKSYDTVTLVKNTSYEYKVDNGNWQDNNVFSNLTPDTSYTFYQRKKGNEFYNPSNTSSGLSVQTLKPPYKTMTAVIDQANSNPLTCITYEDDASGMTKGSSEWDKFFGAKLVLFKDGKEVRELKDNELNSLSQNDGDVMVKFKRMGLNIKTVGDKVYVSMTDNPNDINFKYYAHTRGTTRKEAFYLGAYLGFLDGNKLRSLTNKKPQDNTSINSSRTYAQANGSGYDLCGFYQLTFLQAMYVLKYGNLDAQTAIGKGLTGGDENTTNTTGATNGKGIDYGTTSDTQQMRFQFIEDFYGNRIWAIDGIVTDSSGMFCVSFDKFNSNGNGYFNLQLKALNNGGFVSRVCGSNMLGFLPTKIQGSASTYYSDVSYTYSNSNLFFGGFSGLGSNAGAFFCYFSFYNGYFSWHLAARLMYL